MKLESQSKPEPDEVFRDDCWLVVPIGGARFPCRCVKTNKPVKRTNYEFIADLMPAQISKSKEDRNSLMDAIGSTKIGLGVRFAHDMIKKKRLRYHIALSSAVEQLAIKRRRIGLALVITGPLLSFLGGVLAAVVLDGLNGQLSPSSLMGMVPGLILFVVGIVLFGLSTLSVLRVVRSDGTYVWLEGADPNFLSTLPESPVQWTPPRRRK